eukprot:TCALIF_05278-PA protein Name:"Protein of unknown function" AED:0.12 eAED:0.12 QI:0/0.33/0/0.5/1/1/4/0/1656
MLSVICFPLGIMRFSFLGASLLLLSYYSPSGVFSQEETNPLWSIRLSDPDRQGRFLSVPVQYGNWVPIAHAKQTIEAVASKVQAGLSPVITDDLEVEVVPASVNLVRERVDDHHVEYVDTQGSVNPNTFRRPAWRAQSGNPRQQRPYRRNDGHRGHRRNRKLPSGGNSFVDQLTSFFKPSSKGLGQPQQLTNRPYPPHNAPADSYPAESLNVGTVLNNLPINRLRQKPFVPVNAVPVNPTPKNPAPANVVPGPSFNIPPTQHKETLATNNPVVKLVPAPDLSQEGPPIIELGGSDTFHGSRYQDNHNDHLSGFVPVDFEHITSGEKIERHPDLDKSPKDFSVVVSGLDRNPNPEELAEYLKEGSKKQLGAYIAPNNENIPDGFRKIDLPFMEHDQDVGNLPSVFIAPVGFKVPTGYKGHPLPYDPELAQVNSQGTTPSPSGINLVSRTEPPQETYETTTETVIIRDSAALIKDRIKLAKQRPALSSFYRGKTILETSKTSEDSKKKRRILTKIVRRPFNKVRNFFKSTTPPIVTPTTSETAPVAIVEDKVVPETEDIETRVVNPFLTTKTLDLFSSEASTVPTVPVTTYKPSLDFIVTSTAANNEQEEQDSDIEQVIEYIEEELEHDKEPEPTQPQQQQQPAPEVEATEKEQDYTDETVTSGYEPTVVPRVDHFQPTTPYAEPDTEEEEQSESKEGDESVFVTTQFIPTEPSYQEVSSVSTTESTTTETKAPAYVPTPFSFIRPVRRLDTYRYKKTTPPTVGPPTPQTTTTPTTSAEPEQRRYLVPNRNKYTNKFENKYENTYGQRIRSRKRPAFWANERDQNQDETQLNYQETSESATETSPYDQKFRPFFDQLFDKLTSGGEKAMKKKRPLRRRFKGRRRSTTTPNPFTIDAEIYEVDPNSGEILVETVTEIPTEVTTAVVDDYEIQKQYTDVSPHSNDYELLDVANPTTPKPTPTTTAPTISTESSVPPLEYKEFSLVPDTAIAAGQLDHETADKHSTGSPPQHTHVVQEQARPTYPSLVNIPNPYVYPEAPLNYDYVANDLIDRADIDADRVDYADNINNIDYTGDVQTSAPILTDRLDAYEKQVTPSLAIVRQHDAQYKEPNNLYNEHGQQQVTALEGAFVPFKENKDGFKGYSYVEIQRDVNPTTSELESEPISIESVPVEDIQAVQEALEEVYNDPNVDTLALPVGVEIEVAQDYPVDETTANHNYEQDTVEIEHENTEEEQKTEAPEILVEDTAVDVEIYELPTPSVATFENVDTVSTTDEEIVSQDTTVPPFVFQTYEDVTTQTEEKSVASVIATESTEQTTEQPVVGELIEQEPTPQKPTSQEPIGQESFNQEPTGQEPFDEEPTVTTEKSLLNNFNLGGIFDYFLPQTTAALKPEATTEVPDLAEVTTEEALSEAPSTYPNHLLALDSLEESVQEEEEELKDESVNEQENIYEEEQTLLRQPNRNEYPKAIDTNTFKVPSVPNHVGPPKKFLEDKLGYVVKKRERLIKNWVNRQHKDKPKYGTARPSLDTVEYTDEEISTTSPQNLLAPSTTLTTLLAQGNLDESLQSEVDKAFFPFAPTIPPKGKYDSEEDLDAKLSPKKHQLKKQSFLDKYTTARKTHLLKDTILSKTPASPQLARIPIGRNQRRRDYARGSLEPSVITRGAK